MSKKDKKLVAVANRTGAVYMTAQGKVTKKNASLCPQQTGLCLFALITQPTLPHLPLKHTARTHVHAHYNISS